MTVQDADDRTHDHPAHVTTARQAAEALFRPKAPAPTGRVPATAPPAPDQSGRRPRILRAIEPARSNPEDIVVVALAITTPAAPSVPPSEVPRIKTWLKYGMTTAQVAQVYGVAVTVIERLL